MDSPHFIILVDMDSVIADLEPAFLRRFQELFPDKTHIPLEERRTWRLCDQYPPELVRAVVKEGFYASIKPVPGAIEALDIMQRLPDVEVFICSTPNKQNYASSCAEKFEWISQHIGEEWQSKLILTNDKTLVFGHLLFDDKHEFDQGLVISQWEQILFTDCHNKHVVAKERVRLDSWLQKDVWLPIIQDRLTRWRYRRDYE